VKYYLTCPHCGRRDEEWEKEGGIFIHSCGWKSGTVPGNHPLPGDEITLPSHPAMPLHPATIVVLLEGTTAVTGFCADVWDPIPTHLREPQPVWRVVPRLQGRGYTYCRARVVEVPTTPWVDEYYIGPELARIYSREGIIVLPE